MCSAQTVDKLDLFEWSTVFLWESIAPVALGRAKMIAPAQARRKGGAKIAPPWLSREARKTTCLLASPTPWTRLR